MKEIIIPEYIHALPQEEIDNISTSSNADQLIIACGIHPQDQSLMLITGTADVLSIKPNGRMKPYIAEPLSGGEQLKIAFHHPYGLHVVNSIAAIAVARNEIKEMILSTNGRDIAKLTMTNDM